MRLRDWLTEQGYGSVSRLAKEIESTAVEVSTWADDKRNVPIHRCMRIETATKGRVTRKELRPNDYKDIWPELD